MNSLELTGRTILVTGASSGIGRDTAVLLSQLGARLILGGRNEERLRETLRLLSGEGHRCESFDLSHCEDIPAWLRKSVEVSGPLQGLVHCAGLFALRPLRVLSARTVDEMLQVNVGAAIQLARALSQKGMSVPGASLVFVASVAGLKGQAGLAAYAASKGAIIALTRALAIELAGQRIRVNCVAPGMVRTQLAEELFAALSQEQAAELEREHPLGFGMPRDVSHAIAFLLAETSRWMTGSVLVVDGGFAA